MKRSIFAIIAIFSLLSTSSASADFFLDRVVKNSPEQTRLNSVNLGNYRFQDSANEAQYRESLFFLSRVKNESYIRYENGRMTPYAFSSLVRELEYLTYHLDNAFANLSDFERTGNDFYKTLAMEDFITSKTSYNRVKAITWKK